MGDEEIANNPGTPLKLSQLTGVLEHEWSFYLSFAHLQPPTPDLVSGILRYTAGRPN